MLAIDGDTLTANLNGGNQRTGKGAGVVSFPVGSTRTGTTVRRGAVGDRVWQGNLNISDQRYNSIAVPCVAIRYTTATRTPMEAHDFTGWPTNINCHSTKMKPSARVFPFMNETTTHWYVRFASIDDNRNETSNPELKKLVKVMVQRQLAFEIECIEGCIRGKLYLWGMVMHNQEYSLLGVFRPSREEREAELEIEPKV